MADFRGKFQYSAGSGTQEGSCRLQFDRQTFTLTPESGAPVVCDLGDFDAVVTADYEIRLPLFNGSTLVLRQFGKAYETLSHDLLDAWRQRTLRCLLLEDLEEVARFDGAFELSPAGVPLRSGAAELRLFKSNLAVLPAASQGFQWRLADVDSVKFDPATYEVILYSGGDVLKLSKLAKRTEEFVAKIKEAAGELVTQSAQALHAAFPFLDPGRLRSAAALMREGQPASVAKLAAIHSGLSAALAANAVDKDLKPYFDDLCGRTAKDALYAGFKMVRAEDLSPDSEQSTVEQGDQSVDSATDEDTGTGGTDSDAAAPQVLYWFFFPLTARPGSTELANIVAWEASSRAGRATYFFRLADPAQSAQPHDAAASAPALEAAIRRLNRGLGVLNFRRRPIYLSDSELERDHRLHRYAIAARRIPELRGLRAAFLGRAIHSSFDAWREQVQSILAKNCK